MVVSVCHSVGKKALERKVSERVTIPDLPPALRHSRPQVGSPYGTLIVGQNRRETRSIRVADLPPTQLRSPVTLPNHLSRDDFSTLQLSFPHKLLESLYPHAQRLLNDISHDGAARAGAASDPRAQVQLSTVLPLAEQTQITGTEQSVCFTIRFGSPVYLRSTEASPSSDHNQAAARHPVMGISHRS
ncbi:hypothetical protein BJ322DRAFT_1021071 [Thelephora terrestris]|uniref:Uncharacterized protein n=1 Tax=Thelephora terrestris TaxID=56493 RepID=A0A9P6HFF5_9AGAM|nr:hypothetical protein BJ322DRAFT_1021071 [Thelephora terrestris]